MSTWQEARAKREEHLAWLDSLQVGDEVVTRSYGSLVIVTIASISAKGCMTLSNGRDCPRRNGRPVGYWPHLAPVLTTTRREMAAGEKARLREEMNNDIREIARRLSAKRAQTLLDFAKGLR